MYKHIIWDFDGTLFDTYPVMAAAFQHTLAAKGLEEPLEDIERTMKVSISHAAAHYRDKYQLDTDFFNRYASQRTTFERRFAAPFPLIPDMCRTIQRRGDFNYLYTHRGQSALEFMDKYHLTRFFRDFITSQQSFPRKPSPDAINYLTKKYGMEPYETLMIGDRAIDILAAHNAGIHSCLFADHIDIQCPSATHRIESLDTLLTLLDLERAQS